MWSKRFAYEFPRFMTHEPTWEVSMTGRSRINSALLVGYGAVDILEVASVFETL